jgi:hypothetical protein
MFLNLKTSGMEMMERTSDYDQAALSPSSARQHSTAEQAPSVQAPSVPTSQHIPNPNKHYYILMCSLYAAVTFWAVLDRFTTNVSPRQDFGMERGWEFCQKPDGEGGSKSACGGDFFCEDEYFCLKPGPCSVKIFDALSRISGRVIITSTTVIFLTTCHATFNMLATLPFFQQAHPAFLCNVKSDNVALHSLAGKIVGFCTVVHVYSLLLPSILSGYANVLVHPGDVGETLTLPLQVALGTSQITDVDIKEARWGYDDVWRIVWMSLIFLVLFPLTRSNKLLLSKHWNLAIALHVAVGVGYFIDSARRRSHPHVWLWNIPFFVMYAVDRILSTNCYLVAPKATAHVYVLDDNYICLTFTTPHVHEFTICDIFRMKSSTARLWEWYHPFTTATNRLNDAGDVTLEVPSHADNHEWMGHKFRIAHSPSAHETIENKHGVQRFTMGQSSRSLDLVKVHDPHDADVRIGKFRSSTLLNSSSRSAGVVLGAASPVATRKRPTHLMQKQRTSAFSLFKQKNKELESAKGLNDFTNMCVVRVHPGGATQRWTDEANVCMDQTLQECVGKLEMDILGGSLSEYSLLPHLIGRTPLLIVATGAGAGLILDVVSYIRAYSQTSISEENHVDLVFSTWSLPLLQFVTNSVLCGTLTNVSMTCALTRQDEMELEDCTGKGGGLDFSRIDLDATVASVTDDREQVFFCGSGAVSARLNKACATRGLKFVGAAVEA